MATYIQPVPATLTSSRILPALVFVAAAVCLPVLAGLAWHQTSDNPIWPLVRHTLGVCELRDAQLSPLSPDGRYRAHVVQATCLGRFDETLVFVSGAADAWSHEKLNPDDAIFEGAGLRSLDAINWQENSTTAAPVLQLWLLPGAAEHQIHRVEHVLGPILITTQTSTAAPGSERLDY